MPTGPSSSNKPKKLIRQRDVEKSLGEGANPSQLGDPVSLEIETNAVPPGGKPPDDFDIPWAMYKKPQPAGGPRDGKGGVGGVRKMDGSGTDYNKLMAGWDIAGGTGGYDSRLNDGRRILKL